MTTPGKTADYYVPIDLADIPDLVMTIEAGFEEGMGSKSAAKWLKTVLMHCNVWHLYKDRWWLNEL